VKLPSRSADPQNLNAGLDHLGPDAITAHDGDLVRTHVFLLVGGECLEAAHSDATLGIALGGDKCPVIDRVAQSDVRSVAPDNDK